MRLVSTSAEALVRRFTALLGEPWYGCTKEQHVSSYLFTNPSETQIVFPKDNPTVILVEFWGLCEKTMTLEPELNSSGEFQYNLPLRPFGFTITNTQCHCGKNKRVIASCLPGTLAELLHEVINMKDEAMRPIFRDLFIQKYLLELLPCSRWPAAHGVLISDKF